jgi:hypothetical protein
VIISGDRGRVSEVINSMAKDVRSLLNQAIEISYFSRGAIQYETVLQMTPLERDLAIQFINKRLEIAAKSPFPIY